MYEAHANSLEPVADAAAEADVAYAGWWRRVAASLIDTGILLGILFVGILAMSISTASGSSGATAGVLMMSSFILALCFYDPICHAVWEQTIGKRVLKIKLVNDRGGRVGFGRSLWRHVAKLLLGIVPLLGLLDSLNPLSSKKSQTVHDSIANTIVVRTG